MSKTPITITDEQAQILREALQERCMELDKIATGLMKKHLPAAATPVYEEIKRLQKMIEKIAAKKEPAELDV